MNVSVQVLSDSFADTAAMPHLLRVLPYPTLPYPTLPYPEPRTLNPEPQTLDPKRQTLDRKL